MAIAVQSLKIGSQKSEDPHVEQKPRRTFSEDLEWWLLRLPGLSSQFFGPLSRSCSALHPGLEHGFAGSTKKKDFAERVEIGAAINGLLENPDWRR